MAAELQEGVKPDHVCLLEEILWPSQAPWISNLEPRGPLTLDARTKCRTDNTTDLEEEIFTKQTFQLKERYQGRLS